MTDSGAADLDAIRRQLADLLAQNQVLRYSQASAEAASERFETLFASVPVALMVLDEHDLVVQSNATAARWFQPDEDDRPLNFLMPFVAPSDVQRVRHAFDAARVDGRAEAAAVHFIVESLPQSLIGDLHIRRIEAPPELALDGWAPAHSALQFICAVVDITDRQRAERDRDRLETKLRESQKMQAIGTMAGGIAHDFNNILGAILGNADLALAELAHQSSADAKVQTSLREIVKAGRRARDLVRQILAFSRNDPPKLEPVRLADTIEECMRLLRVTLPPAVVLRAPEASEPLTVLADATQLQQAVLNLGANAISAIVEAASGREQSAQGVVAFELERVDLLASLLPGHRVQTADTPTVACAALRVRDTGRGMDAPTLARVFEPFFTTKPVGQGTGLGLAVVHGVMTRHGGFVDVQSTPGSGSCFSLYLPLADAANQSTGSSPAARAEAPPDMRLRARPGVGKHVVYVDDDEALVFLVQRVLRRMGYRVSGHTDPEAAVAALRAAPDGADLLVTDYNMPGRSGVELLREVKAIAPTLPVALASGYVTPEIEREALAAGALTMFHKPNDMDSFCRVVQDLIGPAAGPVTSRVE